MKHRRAWLFPIVAVLLAGPCRALEFEHTRTDLRLALSADFIHARGSAVAAARYGGALGVRAGYFVRTENIVSAPDFFVGADYVWTIKRWRLGLGGDWINKKNRVNGTQGEFDVSVGYDLTERVFVEWRHLSHGRRLGIEKDAPNAGWNLVGIGIIF